MKCDHCGKQVPEGVFCTACGAHQSTTEGTGDPKARLHHFAAHPGEHVATPNVFTTLFPHLAGHRVHEFRYAFLGGLVILALLYGFGLIVSAVLVAAVLVPVLYLVYLFDTQVYRDQPALVIGMTMGLGALLGVAITLINTNVFSPLLLPSGYATAGDLLEATVLIPLIQLVFVAIPALLLRSRPSVAETADGLVLGVAAGLGFSAAETIVRFSSVIVGLPVKSSPAAWIFPLLSICVFIPLLHGTSAGLVAASMWPRQRTQHSARMAALGLPAALVLTIAFFLVGQLIRQSGTEQILWLGWQALVVGLMLVYLRFLLHFALLDEAADMGFSAQVCASCHKHVMAAAFCPACGMALSVSPRKLRKPKTAAPASAEPAGEGA